MPGGPRPIPVLEIATHLAEGKLSVYALAAKYGARRSTIRKWRDHPSVQAALKRIQDERAARIGARLADLEDLAVETYADLLSGKDRAAPQRAVRRAAARDVLELNGRAKPAAVQVEHSGEVRQVVTLDLRELSPEQLAALVRLPGE